MADNTTTQFSATATDTAGQDLRLLELAHLHRGLDSAGGPDDHRHRPGLAGQQQLPQGQGHRRGGHDGEDLRLRHVLRLTRGSRAPPPPSPPRGSPSPWPTTRRPSSAPPPPTLPETPPRARTRVTYVEDSTPPAAPDDHRHRPRPRRPTTTPPRIKGTAAGGHDGEALRLPACTGSPGGTGLPPRTSPRPGITVCRRPTTRRPVPRQGHRRRRQHVGMLGAFKYVEDSNPPDTTITPGPTGTTTDRQPTFYFKSSESNSTFKCRYDSETFRACSGNGSDTPATALSLGTHTFYVRARRRGEERRPDTCAAHASPSFVERPHLLNFG